MLQPSPVPPPGEKASSKTAPPDFSPLIEKNLVLPDEDEGPYAFDRYQTNDRGADQGFFDNSNRGGYTKWRNNNLEKLKKWPSLAAVDWDHPDAPDPDFALQYCGLAGMKVNMSELRPEVVKAQTKMKEGYGEAFEQAFAGAGPTLEKIKQLKKDGPKKERQPGGRDLDIFGLFKGALGAIGELWAYGLEVREASGEHDAGLSWGIKKAVRIWYKRSTKYDGDLSCVTDCARISIVLTTPDGLYAAAKKLLERASTFKNRVANRTDEGYADLMFTLPMSNGHICEVQLHLAAMMSAKKDGGHKACRRRASNSTEQTCLACYSRVRAPRRTEVQKCCRDEAPTLD